MDTFLEYERKKKLVEELVEQLRKEKNAFDENMNRKSALGQGIAHFKEKINYFNEEVIKVTEVYVTIKKILDEERKEFDNVRKNLQEEKVARTRELLLFLKRQEAFMDLVQRFIRYFDAVFGSRVQQLWSEFYQQYDSCPPTKPTVFLDGLFDETDDDSMDFNIELNVIQPQAGVHKHTIQFVEGTQYEQSEQDSVDKFKKSWG